MSTAIPSLLRRELELAGQTVVVIGGSAGIGRETARLAHAEGATLVLTARNPERLQHVARELTTASTVAFDDRLRARRAVLRRAARPDRSPAAHWSRSLLRVARRFRF